MRKLLFTFLFALVSLLVMAQTLEECRSLAREHYPEIRQYDLISQTEQYNLSNAARAWIPQIAISAQATYQTATPTYPEALNKILEASGVEMSGIRKDQYKVGIDIQQNIWDGGLSSANKAIAESEAAEGRSRVDVSLYDLQSRVDNLYFGILLLEERVSQVTAQISILESNLAKMRSCLNNGLAMQSDVDAMEAEVLTARQTLRQVESSRESYRRMLEVFIGQSLSSDKLERPASVEILSRTSARPELALFKAQEDKLLAQRKAINSTVMPRFNAFAQAYYGYP
jgi:outer membrane protein TolC